MELGEAQTSAKAIYLQAAALAGLTVGPQSPERFSELVKGGFSKVSLEPHRRPEAVANMLKVIAETLLYAQETGDTTLGEGSVDEGKDRAGCPVFPFDKD